MKESYLALKNTLPKNVTLLAVSKTKSQEEILELYNLNQKEFGENKVQELIEKQENLPKDIKWHMIGHLQANKVKYIAPFIHLIHSIDSLKLVDEINKQAEKNNRVIEGLLQIKIADEETKYGLSWEEALEIYTYCKTLNHVKIVGIMGMATNTQDQSKIKQEFAQLNKYFNTIKNEDVAIEILSMGMSHDYVLAINEGSNLIRLGSLLFGNRANN